MHAQLVRAQYNAGKVDEAVRIYRESVLPAVQGQPGTIAVYFLVNRAENIGASLSIFESEEAAEAIASSGLFQEQVGKLAAAGVYARPPERHVFEVVAHA